MVLKTYKNTIWDSGSTMEGVLANFLSLSALPSSLLLDCADTTFMGLELQRRNTSVRSTSRIGIPVKLKDQFVLTLSLIITLKLTNYGVPKPKSETPEN